MKNLEAEISRRIREMFTDVLRTREDLHGYQADKAIPFLKANPFSALFIDMGMGKTVCAWTVIADLLAEFDDDDKTLIIGPMRVATQTWPNEKREWLHIAHLNHTVIHIDDKDPRVVFAEKAAEREARAQGKSGAEARAIAKRHGTVAKDRLRVVAAHSEAPIHIISQDWVEWLVEHYQHKWPYRRVFIDESSGFKDHTTKRYEALSRVRAHVEKGQPLITRLHEFTATPAAESYVNFFAQMYLLDGGKALGKSFKRFVDEFFTQNKYTRKYDLRPNGEEALLAKIAHLCLVMKAKDYLDLREPRIIRRPVTLGAAEMDLYVKLETDFIVTLPDGSEVEAETAAALSAKLRQMASGVLYETYVVEDEETDDLKKVKKVHHIHDQKLDELEEIVEEAQGQPILVAYHWKSSLARLQKRFPKAVVMDREGKCVKAWNAKKIPMLLMHPQSGGHGLNLQHGGHILVFFDLIYSLELFLQQIGRLARQGQKNLVLVYLLTAVGTIDEVIADCVKAKEDAQDKMFALLRKLIRIFKKARKQKETALVDDEL